MFQSLLRADQKIPFQRNCSGQMVLVVRDGERPFVGRPHRPGIEIYLPAIWRVFHDDLFPESLL